MCCSSWSFFFLENIEEQQNMVLPYHIFLKIVQYVSLIISTNIYKIVLITIYIIVLLISILPCCSIVVAEYFPGGRWPSIAVEWHWRRLDDLG